MLFRSAVGSAVRAGVCPQRAPRLKDGPSRKRRNALWLHATTQGLFDPQQNRERPYSVADLAALWGVTTRTVRNGIREAFLEQERLKTHAVP
jgi:hypothetical protein